MKWQCQPFGQLMLIIPCWWQKQVHLVYCIGFPLQGNILGFIYWLRSVKFIGFSAPNLAGCPLCRTDGADEVSHESWQIFIIRCVGVTGCISNKLKEIHWCVPPFPCSLSHCSTLVIFSVQSHLAGKQSQASEAITSHRNNGSPSNDTQFLCGSYAMSCSRDTFGIKEHGELLLPNQHVSCFIWGICYVGNWIMFSELPRILLFSTSSDCWTLVIPLLTSGFACFQLFSAWWWGSSVLSWTQMCESLLPTVLQVCAKSGGE